MASASSTVPPNPKSSPLSSAFKTVRTAVAVPENELRRWRRTFEVNAKVINGEKWVLFNIITFIGRVILIAHA